MKIYRKKLDELVEPEKNCRTHNATQIKEFEKSLKMFGQIRPIVIDENNVILAGNGLWRAMKEMGEDKADVYVVNGLTEVQKKKLMLADNRIFSLGSDNMMEFEDFIKDLEGDFDVPGYDAEMLSALVMTDEDIDDIINNYGVVTNEQKVAMEKAKESQEKFEEDTAKKSERVYTSSDVDKGEAKDRQEVLNNRYLICPKCGEKIWL